MDQKKKSSFTIKFLVIILIVQNIFLLLLASHYFKRMDARFNSLDTALSLTQDLVEERIHSVGQEMEAAISMQSSLTSDFHYNLQPAPRGKVLLTLDANLKNYSSGSAVSFTVTPNNGETSLVKTTVSNNALSATVTLPVCDTIKVGLVITDNSNTQSQALEEIKNVTQCLTDHLYLSPDLAFKQEGADLFLSGSYSLLNEYGSLPEQQLDMVRLEITQEGTTLHSFYFSQDFESALPEGQDNHVLLFERIRLQPKPGSDVTFSIRARDNGGFEYLCASQIISVNSDGLAADPVLISTDFELVD